MIINLDTYMIGLGRFPLKTLIPLALKFGYGAIQFPIWEINSTKQAIMFKNLISARELKWGLLPSEVDLFSECSEKVFHKQLEDLKKQMYLAFIAGVNRYYNGVWPGSNTRNFDENFEWCVNRAAKIFKVANDYGIKYGLEFLGPKTLQDSFKYPFIRKLKDGLFLLNSISNKIGIVIDTFHWYTSGDTLKDLKLIGDGNRIVSVHLNDGWNGRNRDEQNDLERELPLYTRVIDSPSVIKVLNEIGYKSIVTVEPFEPANSRLRVIGLEKALQVVAESVKKVFSEAEIN